MLKVELMVLDSIITFIVNNPAYWPIGIAAFSGYVLLSSIYKDHKPWRSLSSAHKLAFGGGFGLLLWMMLLPVSYVVTVFLLHASENALLYSSLACAVLALHSLIQRILGQSEERVLLNFRAFLIGVAILSVSLTIGITLIQLAIHSYTSYVYFAIEDFWFGFEYQSYLILSTAMVVVIYTLSVKPRQDDLRKKLPLLATRRAEQIISAKSRILRELKTSIAKAAIVAFLITTIITAAIIPLDVQLTLFTPKVSAGIETFYPPDVCPGGDQGLVMVRYGNGTYKFYQTMQLNYTIKVPSAIRLLQQVFLPNPSNFSSYAFGAPDSPRAYPWYYLRAESKDVRLSFVGPQGRVSAIVADLASVKDSMAIISVYYWQQFLSRKIAITEKRYSTQLGNGSSLERYTLIFANNENICVTVPRIELGRILDARVNLTNVRPYVNGTMAASIEAGGVVRPWGFYVYPGKALNVTIVFPMSP